MVKTEFSIKDLENLSNVKAHTIRIWEKRYNLLAPDRTDTNIRKYDLDSLKKLLNITYLYKTGHKISKLAEMSQKDIEVLIKADIKNDTGSYVVEIFKATMLEFDAQKFDDTLENLKKKKNFSSIFSEIFLPLLGNTGILWLTGTIDPSHEHFISEKIKHALIHETSSLKKSVTNTNSNTYVLFLPTGEMHEISLLYANYELIKNGCSTLYLGPNISLDSLKHVQKQKSNLVFVSYFTVQPESDQQETYVHSFQEILGLKNELWILGKRHGQQLESNGVVKTFESVADFKVHLKQHD